MQLLKSALHVEEVNRHIAFTRDGEEAAEWSFDCDENGNVGTMADYAYANWVKVSSDPNYTSEIVEWVHSYTLPAEYRCFCGRTVYIDSGAMTSTCDCGRDYNWNGELLAPRSQWGEETGESAADILNYDYRSMPDL